MRWRPVIAFFALSACGSGPGADVVSGIDFAEGAGSVTGGVCSATARLVSVSAESVSLVSLAAVFKDGDGVSARYVLSADEIALAAGTTLVPGRGILSLPLTFDLGASGVSPPADGSIVIVGSRPGGTDQFVGSLRCGG